MCNVDSGGLGARASAGGGAMPARYVSSVEKAESEESGEDPSIYCCQEAPWWQGEISCEMHLRYCVGQFL